MICSEFYVKPKMLDSAIFLADGHHRDLRTRLTTELPRKRLPLDLPELPRTALHRSATPGKAFRQENRGIHHTPRGLPVSPVYRRVHISNESIRRLGVIALIIVAYHFGGWWGVLGVIAYRLQK